VLAELAGRGPSDGGADRRNNERLPPNVRGAEVSDIHLDRKSSFLERLTEERAAPFWGP